MSVRFVSQKLRRYGLFQWAFLGTKMLDLLVFYMVLAMNGGVSTLKQSTLRESQLRE